MKAYAGTQFKVLPMYMGVILSGDVLLAVDCSAPHVYGGDPVK